MLCEQCYKVLLYFLQKKIYYLFYGFRVKNIAKSVHFVKKITRIAFSGNGFSYNALGSLIP